MSTDAKLTPEQIIEAYGERWSIESMFNQLKLSWGLKEAWQQTRQTSLGAPDLGGLWSDPIIGLSG